MFPERRLAKPSLQPGCCHWIILKHSDVFSIFQAASKFNFPKLNRLESAGRTQPISKLNEVRWHHRFEHAEFRNEKPDNRSQPAYQAFALDHITLIKHLKNLVDFVEGELKPEFENLMDNNE